MHRYIDRERENPREIIPAYDAHAASDGHDHTHNDVPVPFLKILCRSGEPNQSLEKTKKRDKVRYINIYVCMKGGVSK